MKITLQVSEEHDLESITINNIEYTLDDYDKLPWLQVFWDEANAAINLI